jgi:uncharacterized membrane protein
MKLWRSHVTRLPIKPGWVTVGLLCLLLLGTGLRFYGLGDHTIGHIEMYVPGIDLPEGLADIPPRLTLARSIIDPIAGEPHPPGFYVFMFFWTKLFGASIVSLRLPAALFGIGCILLVFVLASQTEANQWVALLAAGMVALNGNQIFWSQIAKMMTMGTFLGLLATILLVWLLTARYQWWLMLSAYLGVMLAGLATTIFVWPIFATHVLWTAVNSLINRRFRRGLLRWQIFTFMLGSPLWAIAAYASRRPSYLDPDMVLPVVGQYLQFGFLFQPDSIAVFPSLVSIAFLVLLLVGILLLIVGLRETSGIALETVTVPEPTSLLMVAGALGMSAGIALFAMLSWQKDPTSFVLVLSCSVLPLLLLAADVIVSRFWSDWQIAVSGQLNRLTMLSRLSSLNTFLALLPITMLALVSLVVTPILAPRNIFMATPDLVIVLSRGVVTLTQRHRRWATVIVLLVAIHIVSIAHYSQIPRHPRHYKGLAEQWMPRIADSDLIFVVRKWYTTPIFYYLDADEYQFIARDYEQAVAHHPQARIWVLEFEGTRQPKEIPVALVGYEPIAKVEARRIRAVLYVRSSP